MSVMTSRSRVVALLAAAFGSLLVGVPALAAPLCGSRLAQERRLPPLADPLPHVPINGTAGFVVPGARTLPGGDLSIGLGYLGQQAVCQQEDGIFDQNSLFFALGYGLTERLQLSLQLPYTWYEADRSDFEGDGLDDLSLGVSYRFLDEAGLRPALAAVGFVVPATAERSEGLGTNEWGFGAGLAASKTLVGPLSAFASAAYVYNGRGSLDVDDQFVSGAGLEFALTPQVSLLTEVTANTNWREGRDRHSDWISELHGGVRFRFGGFLVSVAGRKGLTNDAPDWGVFALVTYEARVGTPFGAGRAAGAAAGGPGAGAPGGAPGAGAAGPGGPGAPGAAPGVGGPGAGAPGAGVPGAGAPGGGPGAAAGVTPGAVAPPAAGAAPGAGAPGAGAAGPGGPGAPGAAPGAGAPGAGGPGAGAPQAPGAAGAPGAAAPGAGPGGGPGAAAGVTPGAVAAVPPAALPPALRATLRDINFEFDRYDLTEESRRALDELAQALKANPQFTVLIEGHADERGTVEYNLALGEQRAQAAKRHLVAAGVEASRIDTISYGEQRPIEAGHDELSWAINRRAHFVVRGR
jgi:peptidoglycan-associated lipoprotein